MKGWGKTFFSFDYDVKNIIFVKYFFFQNEAEKRTGIFHYKTVSLNTASMYSYKEYAKSIPWKKKPKTNSTSNRFFEYWEDLKKKPNRILPLSVLRNFTRWLDFVINKKEVIWSPLFKNFFFYKQCSIFQKLMNVC